MNFKKKVKIMRYDISLMYNLCILYIYMDYILNMVFISYT